MSESCIEDISPSPTLLSKTDQVQASAARIAASRSKDANTFG
jgi:hypothetical protein